MTDPPLIFITNDDGIASPGLHAAVDAVLDLGTVVVVAPSTQQTATGRSCAGNGDATLHPASLMSSGRRVEAYHCPCTPAQVVRHGLQVRCAARLPDLLISGINYGENVGNCVTISGTVGAALEGASHGIPALAVSLETDTAYHLSHTMQDWRTAAHFLHCFTRGVLAGGLPFDVDVLKVDIPDSATPATPWRLTRQSRQGYFTTFLEQPLPDSRLRDAVLRIAVDVRTLERDSDIYALKVDRVVAVTPLSLDLTSRADPATLRDLLGGT
ncbi:MAG: 5'/3'-nucleotidase SurE [Acidobacteria bacterium]|nr:5'/3'-nucleotidase SurE [Acidobacteriota bacterium]